jgi:UDP-N-acetylmuramoyl-tripeptide--D-alanyl-D-alanine ligase
MFVLLNTLWLIWMLKYVLFWLYLWQLKEYHIGRFIDHFRTHKGKSLILNFEQILKLVIFVFLISTPKLFSFLFFVVSLVYFAEVVLLARAIFKKSIKKPVKTVKIIFLSIVSFGFIILFLAWVLKLENESQIFWLLAFDILTPIIISVIVLIFQPGFVVIRQNKMRKAGKKLEKIKSLSGVKIIAITGSYGKTSTKEFLTTILSKKFKVLSTSKHQNAEIGIANCILNDLKPSHQFFIAEVGAYNKGKVKEVCNMLKPKIGIVTGVNQQHLSLFGSLKNLLSAEGGVELAQALPKDGLLVVNGDNKFCLDLLKKSNNLASNQEKKYTISNKSINADIWTEDVIADKQSISFISVNKNHEMGHFKVSVLGKQNVQNLLAAILVARELGMGIDEISEACKNIRQEQAGMVLRHGKHGICIVDSSYSSNPDGVFADLDYFALLPGKKAIIMPCLIELGLESSKIHQKIGRKIGQVCDLAIITSKDKFEDIKKGAVESGMSPKSILLCDKSEEISTIISLTCKSGDAVLLEGRVPLKLHELF